MYRILKLAPTPFFADRGCHIRILELTRHLLKVGNEIQFYTYHPVNDSVRKYDNNLSPRSKFSVTRIPSIRWLSKIYPLLVKPTYHMAYMDLLLFGTALYKLNSKNNSFKSPNLIHAYLHEGGFISYLITLFHHNKLPVVLDLQSDMVAELLMHKLVKPKSICHSIFEYLQKFIEYQPEAIVTSSKQLARDLQYRYRGLNKKIYTVEDGVDTNRFHPGLKTTKPVKILRKKLHLPEDAVVSVYLGGLGAGKGTDYLLNAIKYVLSNKRAQNIYFLIMGYPGEDYCNYFIQKHKLQKYVRVTGRIAYEQAPLYLALGDIAIAPKTFDSNENNGKIYTYMSMGLPTVAFDHPVNFDILKNLGVYAEYKDAESLGMKILELATTEATDLRVELGIKLREFAVKFCSWSLRVNKLMKIYARI